MVAATSVPAGNLPSGGGVSPAGVVPGPLRMPQVQDCLDLGLALLLSEVTGLALDPEAFPLRPGAGPPGVWSRPLTARAQTASPPPSLNWHYCRLPCTDWVLWP